MTVTFPITTVVYDNADLLPRILALYGKPGMTIADVTYDTGKFWEHVDTMQYQLIKSDIAPKSSDIICADCRRLEHLADGSVSMIVLDPPYMCGVKVRDGYNSSYNVNEAALRYLGVVRLYTDAMQEAAHKLTKKGLLCAKTMDVVESGHNHWMHIDVYNIACRLGFEALDLFIYTKPPNEDGTVPKPRMRHKHQQHARKQHSYMWVMRKP